MAQTIPSTVLITRPQAAAERFGAALQVPVVISALMEPIWLDPGPLKHDPDALVFTSGSGVTGFIRLNKWRGPAYCVGDTTAQTARDAGFDATSAGGDMYALAKLLKHVPSHTTLLHACGRHIAGSLGAQVLPYIVYEQRPLKLNDEAYKVLNGRDPVIVPLFSPRSASLFIQQLPQAYTAPLVIIAISDAVARIVKDANIVVSYVAGTPDGASMLHAVQSALLGRSA